MKYVIELSEKDFDNIKHAYTAIFGDIYYIMQGAIANGTPLPKGATNGDMIKAMTGEDFSRGASIYNHDLMIGEGEDYLAFSVDWWNAPYKAEKDEV